MMLKWQASKGETEVGEAAEKKRQKRRQGKDRGRDRRRGRKRGRIGNRREATIGGSRSRV